MIVSVMDTDSVVPLTSCSISSISELIALHADIRLSSKRTESGIGRIEGGAEFLKCSSNSLVFVAISAVLSVADHIVDTNNAQVGLCPLARHSVTKRFKCFAKSSVTLCEAIECR